ncbi:homeobox protein CDX-1-like [Mobula birostris]|uniref:homeobox protein CDX-1-like n=1 Tax=Mobula birostris TaxID=1983395 RepID=UPI003B2896C1
MYVSYLLDKEGNMYSNSVRHPALNLNPQNFAPPPPPPPTSQYPDFPGYHVSSIGPDPHHTQPAGAWGTPYMPPREEWHSYGGAAPMPVSSSGSQLPFGPSEFAAIQPQGTAGLLPPVNTAVPQLSPGSPKRNPYDWMRRSLQQNPQGKTRTKDKYRVVYTDYQRLELEKEFHYSRYITIRRKSELALSLGLSERQVKIWFQNRRAKERKINKKKMQQQSQQASSTTASPRALPAVGLVSSSSNLVPQPLHLNIKEEYLS